MEDIHSHQYIHPRKKSYHPSHSNPALHRNPIAMTTPQWSPASVLQLDPNSTCIGHAKTQGRRCRNPIAYANRKEATNILHQMSRRDPFQSQRLDSQLEELASRLLCKRWHQDQAMEIKRQWRRRIVDFQAAETARQAERSRMVDRASESARAAVVARNRVASVRREVVTSSITTSSTRESSSLAIISIVIREELREREDSEPNDGEPRQQTNPGPDSPNQPEAPSQESTDIPRPTSSADEPTTQTPAPPLQEPIATSEARQVTVNEAEPSSAVPSTSTQAPHPQHEDSHPATHDRRAIEGDCSICCEDFSNGGTTKWCRAQCRQNFHADCIDLWHASLEADGRIKTCPYW